MTGPLKWHGGKSYLADWIISLMPPRCKNPNDPARDKSDNGWLHYVEPYFGGGAVLLANDPEGISEVVNDINGTLIDFWTVLQHDHLFQEFNRLAEMTPFSQDEFETARAFVAAPNMNTNYGLAWRFFVFCRQSLSGRMKDFASLTRNRTRRGMNEQASAWLNAVDGLGAVHERLQRVVILNKPALDVIRKQDGPRTLFYLDPPYLHETRVGTDEYGDNEMTREQHGELMAALSIVKGRFLLSGYPSKMYDDCARLNGWSCHEKKIDNKAAGGKTKRKMIECVWTNF